MQGLFALTVAAAQTTAWENLKRVPKDMWINLAICVLAVLIIVRVWRALKRINDYAPYFAMALAVSGIFFYWVFNRTEPRFLTPLVERLTPFFPTKTKQERDLEKLRRGREI